MNYRNLNKRRAEVKDNIIWMKKNFKYKKSDWFIFQGKYDVDKNGCWIWNKAVIKSTGYGRMGMQDGSVDYAHRAAWKIFKGEIPKGLFVCHTCDVRKCVNPDHLFLGLPRDNIMDSLKKGRNNVPVASFKSDESHQVAKLTNKQVRFIRCSKLSGVVLSQMFGVTQTAISCARLYKTFRDVK